MAVSRVWLKLRTAYRWAVSRWRFVSGGPPALYAVSYRGPGGEIRKDHLLNITSQEEHLDADGHGLVCFRDIEGHASWYASSVILRIRRRESMETKLAWWPQSEGATS